MTLSAVEICNLALANVPAKRIVSMNDTTVAAQRLTPGPSRAR